MTDGPELSLSLRTVVGWLETPNEDRLVFLDRRNGELIVLSRAEAAAFTISDEYVDDEADDDDSPYEDPTAHLLLAQSAFRAGHFLPLPTRFDFDEHRILAGFCDQVPDDRVRAELLLAIQGPGALDRFRLLAWQRGLAEAWEAFRERAVADFAAAWLAANGIACRP